MCMGANLSYFDCMYSVCFAFNDHYPLPLARTLNYFNWVGGSTGREVKGEECIGGGCRKGGVKAEG